MALQTHLQALSRCLDEIDNTLSIAPIEPVELDVRGNAIHAPAPCRLSDMKRISASVCPGKQLLLKIEFEVQPTLEAAQSTRCHASLWRRFRSDDSSALFRTSVPYVVRQDTCAIWVEFLAAPNSPSIDIWTWLQKTLRRIIISDYFLL